MRLWALRNRIRDLFGLAPVPPPRGAPVPPTPRVRVEMALAVPGAVVRLAPAAAVGVVALLAGCSGGGWLLAAAAAVGVVCWPGSAAAAVFMGLTGIWVIAGGDLLAVDPVSGAVPGVWRMAGLILTVHLLVVGTAFAGHVAWRSFVEGAVVARVLGGVFITQAFAQSLLLLAAWLRAWQPVGLEWLRVVAVTAVVGVVALAVPREWLAGRGRRRVD